ncbi:MAG: tRNA pseudouridine(55) synthase TruB [Pelovirga sp.]
MHGLLLIDKPAGVTSHDVVQKIRRICATRKVGHAGTLDPLATGVLVVAVGDATKILQFLFTDEKSYRAVFKLGETTDTYDAQGTVLLRRPLPLLDEGTLETACQSFRGEISQLPPMYSALKSNGVPLYRLARQGKEIAREPRQIRITRLQVIAVAPPEVTIEVDCSKGTYIRSLVHDLGEQLGCGAHLTALRRLRSGRFGIDQCYSLAALAALPDPATALLGLGEALADYPVVRPDQDALAALSFGIPPLQERCLSETPLADGDLVRLQDAERMVAVARYRPRRENEKRGDFELIRVFPEV